MKLIKKLINFLNMIIDNLVNTKQKKLYIEDFLLFCEQDKIIQQKELICRRNAIENETYNLPFSNINLNKCDYCLSCFDNKLLSFYEEKILNFEVNSDVLNYICEKYSNYETTETTPLAANLIINMLNNKKNIYSRFSPFCETNIESTFDRDGKLDIVILDKKNKKGIILECKKNAKALSRDIHRDQYNKYNPKIKELEKKYNYNLFFGYIIGGNENLLDKNSNNFNNSIKIQNYLENKNFISLKFLLFAYINFLKGDKNFFLEKIFNNNFKHYLYSYFN